MVDQVTMSCKKVCLLLNDLKNLTLWIQRRQGYCHDQHAGMIGQIPLSFILDRLPTAAALLLLGKNHEKAEKQEEKQGLNFICVEGLPSQGDVTIAPPQCLCR